MAGNKLLLHNNKLQLKGNKLRVGAAGDPCCCEPPPSTEGYYRDWTAVYNCCDGRIEITCGNITYTADNTRMTLDAWSTPSSNSHTTTYRQWLSEPIPDPLPDPPAPPDTWFFRICCDCCGNLAQRHSAHVVYTVERPPYLPPEATFQTEWTYDFTSPGCTPDVGGWTTSERDVGWAAITGTIGTVLAAWYDCETGVWKYDFYEGTTHTIYDGTGDCSGSTFSRDYYSPDYGQPGPPFPTWTDTHTWTTTITQVQACPTTVTLRYICDGVTTDVTVDVNPYP